MIYQTDDLEIGDYLSVNYLRSNEILNSPSIGKLFSFSPAPWKTATEAGVKRLPEDESPVYQVKESNTVTRDTPLYLIEQGKCFYVENVYSLANNETSYILFNASNMTKELRSFPTQWKSSAGEVLITLGVCESYTGGDDITPLNRKAGANSVEVMFNYGGTPVNPVFPAYPTILVGSSSTNQNSGGGSITGQLPIILDTGLIYVFKIENDSGEAIHLYSDIIWFEV